jgi:hypothetical protein
MNMDDFIHKYGTKGVPLLLKRLAEDAQVTQINWAHEIADDLEAALTDYRKNHPID